MEKTQRGCRWPRRGETHHQHDPMTPSQRSLTDFSVPEGCQWSASFPKLIGACVGQHSSLLERHPRETGWFSNKYPGLTGNLQIFNFRLYCFLKLSCLGNHRSPTLPNPRNLAVARTLLSMVHCPVVDKQRPFEILVWVLRKRMVSWLTY